MILSAGISIDGYRLIRKIGQGGFGEVWLAQSQATGAWKALKWIPASSNRHFDQELSSLRRYVNSISSLRCPQLVPIEHVRLDEQGLAYVMPLADGNAVHNPEDPAWEPTTLALLLNRNRDAGSWFTSGEIRSIILDVLAGAAAIADAGLVHRDIKPENVLFLSGRPCLADFGLSTDDASLVSLRGTPHHTAPSWYVENGGNADQWGVAALLYVLLTGNSPDKIGRARFLWPQAGRDSLSKEEQREWQRLHQIVLRACNEEPSQRFLGLNALMAAVASDSPRTLRLPQLQEMRWVRIGAVAALLCVATVLAFAFRSGSGNHRTATEEKYVVRLPNGKLSDPLNKAQIDQLNQETEKQRQEALENLRKSLGGVKKDLGRMHDRMNRIQTSTNPPASSGSPH